VKQNGNIKELVDLTDFLTRTLEAYNDGKIDSEKAIAIARVSASLISCKKLEMFAQHHDLPKNLLRLDGKIIDVVSNTNGKNKDENGHNLLPIPGAGLVKCATPSCKNKSHGGLCNSCLIEVGNQPPPEPHIGPRAGKRQR
jgi:hypothetical protein